MFEKTLVFDGHQRINQMLWNFGVGNRPAFFSIGVEEICNHLRLQPVVICRPIFGL